MIRCFLAGLSLSIVFIGFATENGLSGERAAKPINLTKINTDADEDDPFIVRDGKVLLYTSNKSESYRILQAVWSRGWEKGEAISGFTQKDGNFRSPFFRGSKFYFATDWVPDESLEELKNFDIKVISSGRDPLPILGISTRQDELHPWITRDGSEFYFSRKTSKGWMLFVAKGPLPGPIGEATSVGFDPEFHHATISDRGLLMYLQGPLEKGRVGLFRSRRTSLKGKWSNPERLTMLNDPRAKRGDMSPCLSSDGKKLYFASDRPVGKGGLDIWAVDTSQLTK